MPQFGPVWVSRALAPVLLAATSVATSDVSGAAEGCVVKPSGPAPQGQHWFYRFDREAKRPCWHLGSGVARLALQGARSKSAVDRSNSSAAEASATPALPPQSQPAPAQETAAMPAATGGAPGSDGIGLEMRGWPTAVRFPDLPATKPLRLSDASEPAPAGSPAPAIAPDAAPPQAVARPARPAITGDGEGDHTFALIMVAMALLAIAGPVIHAARRRSDRKVAALCESKPSRVARTVSAPAPASREVALPEPLRQPAPPLSPPDRPEPHEQPEHRDQPKDGTQSKRVQPKSAPAKAEPKRIAPKESVQSKEGAQSKSDQPTASVQSTDGDKPKASDPPKASEQPKLGDQTDDLVEGLRRVVREMVAKQAVSASAA